MDATLASFGVVLVELTPDISATPDIQIHLADTSSIGGAAQGVLGVTQLGGRVTIINGWNWYTGSDTAAVGGDQYDFQTVVTHELGHALGMGHSTDANSVMYPELATGHARRNLTANDLADLGGDHDGDAPEPLMAAPIAVGHGTFPVGPADAARTPVAAPAVPAGTPGLPTVGWLGLPSTPGFGGAVAIDLGAAPGTPGRDWFGSLAAEKDGLGGGPAVPGWHPREAARGAVVDDLFADHAAVWQDADRF